MFAQRKRRGSQSDCERGVAPLSLISFNCLVFSSVQFAKNLVLVLVLVLFLGSCVVSWFRFFKKFLFLCCFLVLALVLALKRVDRDFLPIFFVLFFDNQNAP